ILTNSMHLVEYAFDFSMKRLRVRSTKYTLVIATRTTTRQNTTSILGVISAAGMIEV
ncbi:hypothetical protein K492DRAFT_102146, partial [Lichtheimia hyalospora FSU 10163]